ncbi:Gfo/Idh/MocA family oxidoreductase [Cohnella lubricantis]|uniref:Gfo/Idh/MocA family oxidoreductase n=1 Tax=Cohnella lubricantis TaxID=2163172 RepID=A0A841TAN5_9BACL|nr:Gfo/Idh/MocA family oxidoreductase [Cohnella lubricantis]MBB6677099.1 Gfo/Idh/MocA family oxidoreductase [Cohnella lubricantis]MBP2118946.1 putative dehydrogenase [Cohnella lubricantis]
MVKRYRVAVAGCGGMARTWVEYAWKREDTEIVALVDIHLEAARSMADRYGLTCGTYADLAEAIEASGANLVFDVTIPSTHHRIAQTALEAGCHVFGEKPMAATMEEARDLIRIAEQSGKSHAVMQNRRYNASIRALRALIGAGTIGRVGYIGADFFLGPHFGGFRDAMDSPLILDMAIHTFDQARFITGADPVSVYCHEFNVPGSWYAGNASAICIFEMSDGSVFCYRGSWSAEGAPTSWESSWRITGERGTAIWDGDQAPYAEVAEEGQDGKFLRDSVKVEAPLEWTGRDGHAGCLDEMFASLAEGRRAETDGRDNIHSMAMVLGAIESARTGRKVWIGGSQNLIESI